MYLKCIMVSPFIEQIQYKLLNKRIPYLTSVAYYLDFGNYSPHYLAPNCSAINLESNDGNDKRFAQLSTLPEYDKYRGGLLPKVAVSLLLWSPSETIFVHILVAESWFGAE